jgi:hypothetical protein
LGNDVNYALETLEDDLGMGRIWNVVRSLVGWAKLQRSILASWINKQDDARFRLFINIFLMANVQPSSVFFNGKKRTIERGEVWTTLEELASCSKNLNIFKVKRFLMKLEKAQTIKVESCKDGTIITLLNYSEHQDRDFESATIPQDEMQDNRNMTRNNNATIPQIYKEVRSKNKEEELDISLQNSENPEPVIEAEVVEETTRPAVKSKASEADFLLAEKWAAHAHEVQPWAEQDVAKFADGIRRVRKSIGLSDEEMAAVFEWIRKDEFWRDKALSPGNLLNRSKPNSPRKIDHILQQFKKQWDKAKAVHEWIHSDTDEIDYSKYAGEVKC